MDKTEVALKLTLALLEKSGLKDDFSSNAAHGKAIAELYNAVLSNLCLPDAN